jgi:hypothetical protein
LREWLDARYSAADLYIVCLMHTVCSEQEINIIDKREVIEAKWVPLEELSSNDEGVAKYRMFPNSYRFVKLLHNRFMNSKLTSVDV